MCYVRARTDDGDRGNQCLAVMTLLPAGAAAYVDSGALAGTLVTVAGGAANQTDPHVSGNLVTYTIDDGYTGSIGWRDLATGASGVVPKPAGAHDTQPDVSGSRIASDRMLNRPGLNRLPTIALDLPREVHPVCGTR